MKNGSSKIIFLQLNNREWTFNMYSQKHFMVNYENYGKL